MAKISIRKTGKLGRVVGELTLLPPTLFAAVPSSTLRSAEERGVRNVACGKRKRVYGQTSRPPPALHAHPLLSPPALPSPSEPATRPRGLLLILSTSVSTLPSSSPPANALFSPFINTSLQLPPRIISPFPLMFPHRLPLSVSVVLIPSIPTLTVRRAPSPSYIHSPYPTPLVLLLVGGGLGWGEGDLVSPASRERDQQRDGPSLRHLRAHPSS